jgi:hypothetical protein
MVVLQSYDARYVTSMIPDMCPLLLDPIFSQFELWRLDAYFTVY